MYYYAGANENQYIDGAMTIDDLYEVYEFVAEHFDEGTITVLYDDINYDMDADAYDDEPFIEAYVEEYYEAEWTYGDITVEIYRDHYIDIDWEQDDDGNMEQESYYGYFVAYYLTYGDAFAYYGYGYYMYLAGEMEYDEYGEVYFDAEG